MNVMIISETFGPEFYFGDFAYEMAWAASDLRHSVTVLTSTQDAEHPAAQVLSPFRNWGVLEMKNGMMVLEGYKPDYIHVIQPHGPLTRRWVPHLPAFLTYAKMRFRSRLSLHLVDQEQMLKSEWVVRQLVQVVDTVTTPGFQLPSLMEKMLKGNYGHLSYFRRRTLSPPHDRQPMFLMPTAPTHWRNPEQTVQQLRSLNRRFPDYELVVSANWNSNKNARIKQLKGLMADLPVRYVEPDMIEQAYSQCSAVLLSILDSDTETLYKISQSCMENRAPAILNSEQITRFQPYWSDGENCLVIDDLGSVEEFHLNIDPNRFDQQYSSLSRIYADMIE